MTARPQLDNVDMRLLPSVDEEPAIRMPVTSKKRRLRYTLFDDDESSDDDDAPPPSQQEPGQAPFEDQRSSFPQEEEEYFVLPYQDDASSSSESESDDSDNEPQNQQPEYENEDDLFHAAFVAPEQNRSIHQDKENAQQRQQNDDYPPLNQPSQLEQHDVVDLCASDNDDEFHATNNTLAENRATFQGVRIQKKSPLFNASSRRRFSTNGAAARHEPPPLIFAHPPKQAPNNDDDIVECWSSDDDEGNLKPRAVGSFQQGTASRSNTSSGGGGHWDTHTSFPQGFDDDEPSFVPAPSRRPVAARRSNASNRPRRVRNAIPGINTAASVMLRTNSTTSAPPSIMQQATNDVWYRPQGQEAASTSSHYASTSTTNRNDLMGGSGVGAGSYTFNRDESFARTYQEPPPKRSRKRKAPAKKRSTAKGGSKKKNWGGRKRWNGNKRKGGGKSSGRGRGRRVAASNNDNAEYSRKDPLLNNVGGASITF